MSRFSFPGAVGGIALLLLAASSAVTAQPSLSLTSNLPSPQPVGTTMHWTVTGGVPDAHYRLWVIPFAGLPRLVYDYDKRTEFEWSPIEQDDYYVIVTMRDPGTGALRSAFALHSATSLAAAGPAVTASDHPLVPIYSAPACAPGNRMRVLFATAGDARAQATSTKPCRSGSSMNFVVAGLRPERVYGFRHEVRNAAGGLVELGPRLLLATPRVDVELPATTVLLPAGASSSLDEGILLQASIAPSAVFATDLAGELVWYWQDAEDVPHGFGRPVTGGRFLVNAFAGDVKQQRVIEYDLLGHVQRETNVDRINEQLLALGHDPITGVHHEARRLPNGHTAVLVAIERLLTDVQGEGEVLVIADGVVVLDQSFQVAWFWNSFEHLDPTRIATLGETCVVDQLGCPPLVAGPIGNDWTHANAIAHSAVDGSLTVSIRHQDWLVKIDYADGAGDGAVIWRLGQDGDLVLVDPFGDPMPWFSHQHDGNWVGDGSQIVVYDNNNLGAAADPSATSRGQVYAIDETSGIATLLLNADLGHYAPALGSAQPLLNGNFHFNSGIIPALGPNGPAVSDEVAPDGSIVYSMRVEATTYRSFRLRSLYLAPSQGQNLPLPPAALVLGN